MTAPSPSLADRAPKSQGTPLINRVLGAFAVWTLVLVALVPASVSASASASDEASFISQVNATRASVGLPALQTDVQITNLARSWATSMRDGNCGAGEFICHASPISAGVTHAWAKLGENVGTGPDVASIMNAFIASPGHYANIIDPEFTHIGVGVVWDGNRMFTTHRFMKLQGPAPTTTPPATTAAPAITTVPPAVPKPTTSAPQGATTQPPITATERTEPSRQKTATAAPTRSRGTSQRRISVVLDAIAKLGNF